MPRPSQKHPSNGKGPRFRGGSFYPMPYGGGVGLGGWGRVYQAVGYLLGFP